jgi:Ran GTPase-activating protein (RanGAP) involved in mRNA processing and transport
MIGEKEMIDIAYVLSIDTPLRSLDISKNVVDARASVILANSLRTNSHLRKLDLRENKLGNAGIAVLLEPFIQQQIRKMQFPEDVRARPANNDQLGKSGMELTHSLRTNGN